ncbi:3'-5' exonuclease [Sphingobacterium populi]|uniref:3'-5' exonuclease n=1 Tax=Sphingobacterium sp. CFCC 11742 TaxID=1775560 RepID=UPI0008358848|nr:3'-5' exonuclease [Sphingobacterium sp. CFCC 11742]
MLSFTAIDFELATADYNSICAVGVVRVDDGIITQEYFSLVKPPNNKYMWQTTRVHGIKPKDTAESPTFDELYSELAPLLAGRDMVAHNEKFDRSVLKQTMKYYGLRYEDLNISDQWLCTNILYQQLGFARTKLNVCCKIMDIPLKHHDPLSDARATAMLYLQRDEAPEKWQRSLTDSL